MASLDRQGLGASFTLHRSDVHAQSEADAQETKVRQLIRRSRRGQLIRRGRVQFKELGAPVDNADITKMTTSKLGKVQRMVQNMGTQHQEAARKKGDSERLAEYATTSDVKDGELLEREHLEEDLDENQAQQPNAAIQHGLFGKDMPRCAGRDKAVDGFRMLKEFVRESEGRVQQVKSMVPGTVYGLDYKVSMLDFLMPPRSQYPPASDKRALSARGGMRGQTGHEASPSATPSSARGFPRSRMLAEGSVDISEEDIRPPEGASSSGMATRPAFQELEKLREAERKARHCPGRPSKPQAFHRQVYVSPVQNEMRPRPLPIRLPSLANFIAKSEPAMGGRSERGENSHIREMINELLGLDRDKVLKLDAQAAQDQGGVRRGRTDMKRKIEKQLDVAWENRAFLKKMITGPPEGPREEGKTEPERAAGTSDAPGAAGAEEASGVGHEGTARRKREWTEAEEAEAYAKFVALLREPDPSISPVERLRSTLHAYQESRDKNKGYLQNALYSMDADRLNSLKRRAQHLELSSDGPDAKTSCALMRLEAEKDMLTQHIQERMKKQYLWYRDLWHHVRGDKRDLPKVAHFIFDFVKQVLEYGEEFQKDMYFGMLDQIENYEFTAVIASLIVNMITGIEDVTNQDIVEWFREKRGEVPHAVAELTSKEKDHPTKAAPEVGEVPELGSPDARTKSAKKSLTFVTEMP